MSDAQGEMASKFTPADKAKATEDPTPPDEVHEALVKAFGLGDGWRKSVPLKVRADNLYWLVFLAWEGWKARRGQYRNELKAGRRPDMSEVASLASWQMDLEAFVDQIKANLPKAK